MPTPSQRKVWFITGVSRGLGLALAQAALAAGDAVVGSTRDGRAPIEAEHFHVLALDVTDAAQVPAVVRAAHALHGRIDVLVNNAGSGLLGAVEEATAADVAHIFAVNYLGPLQVMQAALPLLRAQGRGHILNVTSIAALHPTAGAGIYASAKAALDALSHSVAEEVAPHGLHVTAVEPGAFRTDFFSDHSIRHSPRLPGAYPALSARLDSLKGLDGKQAGDPHKAAQQILKAVAAAEPPRSLVLGADAHQRTRQVQARLLAELTAWEADTDIDAHQPRSA